MPFAARVVDANRLLAILAVVPAATQGDGATQIDPGQDIPCPRRESGCGSRGGLSQDPIDRKWRRRGISFQLVVCQ